MPVGRLMPDPRTDNVEKCPAYAGAGGGGGGGRLVHYHL